MRRQVAMEALRSNAGTASDGIKMRIDAAKRH